MSLALSVLLEVSFQISLIHEDF